MWMPSAGGAKRVTGTRRPPSPQPTYRPPVYHAPAPVYRPLAPVYKPPVYRAPAPAYRPPAPVHHYSPPAPVHHAAPKPPPPAPKPPPPPKPPSVSQWLAGDTAYASQQDALKKAISDYIAQMNQQKGQYNTEFQTNIGNLGDSEQVATNDLQNDYASRNMLNSGVYAKAYSDLQGDYDKRQAALEQGKSDFIANLQTGKQNFTTDNNLQLQKARQDAINRRAEKFNLNVK